MEENVKKEYIYIYKYIYVSVSESLCCVPKNHLYFNTFFKLKLRKEVNRCKQFTIACHNKNSVPAAH